VAIVLKPVLVGDDGEHSLQTLVLELDHPAAAFADQMLVVCLGRHGLVTLEPLTEVMGTNQPTLQQNIQSAIYCRRAHLFTLLPEPATDAID